VVFVSEPVAMASVPASAQTTPSWLLPAYLKPFGLPQPVHALDVHTPAFPAKQHRDPAVSEPRPANRQAVHVDNQLTLFVADELGVPLTRPGPTDRPTDPAL